MTSLSNKSGGKDFGKSPSKEDIFTEMRNKASRIDSRIDSVKDNPEPESEKKGEGREGLKKTATRLNTLKKEHGKLKKTMEKEFDGFKNFFYQF